MNITVSVDEQVAQRAGEAAQKMGKSLNGWKFNRDEANQR
jgi:predicted HicB family RNase H-like nuclease